MLTFKETRLLTHDVVSCIRGNSFWKKSSVLVSNIYR